MPVGLQLVAPPGGEHLLLATAAALHNAAEDAHLRILPSYGLTGPETGTRDHTPRTPATTQL